MDALFSMPMLGLILGIYYYRRRTIMENSRFIIVRLFMAYFMNARKLD